MRFFNQINLQTPESVELEFTLAGIGNRSLALIIDYIIVWFTILLVLILAVFLNFQLDSLSQWIWAIQSLIVFAINVGYFVILETLWKGQTPGKKCAKIKVIRDNGKPARLPQTILRALLRPIDISFFFIGVFLIIFLPQEKRLGDLVAGTIVVQEEHGNQLSKLNISDAAENLAVQLRIEAEIANLLPEHFATIRDFLQRRQNMLLEAQHQLSRKLAEQVKEIILIDNVPDGYSNGQFLEAIYLAYQQDNQYT
ncbi:MAG: RDD family protein [Cyanobacteria bacterium J06621_8]